MDIIVPVVETIEVVDGLRHVGEIAGIDWVRLHHAEVSFNARVVIEPARATEKLVNAELAEVLARGIRAHLGAPGR